MTSCDIHDCVTIQSSTLIEAQVKSFTTVGPYAYLRPNSKIGEHVRIGDFVEVKNSTIDDGTKVSHLTYNDTTNNVPSSWYQVLGKFLVIFILGIFQFLIFLHDSVS